MAPTSVFSGAIALALLNAPLSHAAAVSKRSIGFTTTCQGTQNPNWGDCTAAFDAFNTIISDNNGNIPISGESDGENCQTETSGNCVVGACDFLNQGYVLGSVFVDAINDLQTDCQPNGAGGKAQDTDNSMAATVYAAETNPSRLVKAKRDSTWSNAYTIESASPQQYRQQVLSSQPGGSSWQLSQSESQTNKVQVSVSISEDLFDIFQSSQSVSYGYSQTSSETSTEDITNNCSDGQTGTLFWYPYFTQYHGGYSPSGPAPVDIYVPVTESGGNAAGKYQVVCSS